MERRGAGVQGLSIWNLISGPEYPIHTFFPLPLSVSSSGFLTSLGMTASTHLQMASRSSDSPVACMQTSTGDGGLRKLDGPPTARSPPRMTPAPHLCMAALRAQLAPARPGAIPFRLDKPAIPNRSPFNVGGLTWSSYFIGALTGLEILCKNSSPTSVLDPDSCATFAGSTRAD